MRGPATLRAALGTALLLTALAAPPGGAEPPAPLPEVDVSAMEPAVREQVEGARRELAAALEAGAPAAALAKAYGRCGEVYALYQLNAPALAALREAARLAPSDFRWAYLLGVTLQVQGLDAEAEGELGRALALKPGDAPSLARRGELRLRLGRPAEARQDFALLAGRPGFAAAAAAGLGRCAAAEGDFAQAASRFEAALSEQPEAGEIRYQLGSSLRRLGRREEARKVLAAAAAGGGAGAIRFPDPLLEELARRNAGSQRQVAEGTELLKAGRFAEAAEAMRRALAADPENAGAWANLGVAQSRIGDRAGAEASYGRAIALDPVNDLALFNLGTLRLGAGRIAEAIEPLEAAARANPGSKPILFNLGKALNDLGQPARALPYLDRLVALAPEDLEARFNRATALLASGRSTEAVEEFGRVAAGAPQAAEPRYGQALALLGAKRDREARAGLERAIQEIRGSEVLEQLLVRVLAGSFDPQTRDAAKAMEIAQKLAYGGGSNPLDEEAMALALAESGQFLEAADRQRRAIALAETAAPQLVPRLRRCLEAFEGREPCREPWR